MSMYDMNCLNDFSELELQQGAFPLQEVLSQSFFYPFNKTEAALIPAFLETDLHRCGPSFVFCYADQNTALFMDALSAIPGYRIVCDRILTPEVLNPRAWQIYLLPGFYYGWYSDFPGPWKPYCRWVVLDAIPETELPNAKGRLSFLYIQGDPVTAYQTLYWGNRMVPKAVGILQPGVEVPFKWRTFMLANLPMGWVVEANPAGKPQDIFFLDIRAFSGSFFNIATGEYPFQNFIFTTGDWKDELTYP